MDERAALTARFEEERPRLRAVAYRMLGSVADADDAVQEAWIRFSRTDTGGVDNLGGWLTTVVARVCLDMLRSRGQRREEPLEAQPPEPAAPVVGGQRPGDPEEEALMADSVGLALLVVLTTLSPAERLAFVLHDLFAVPFDQIAPIVERTPVATKKLASRARHRVRGTTTLPDPDLTRRRQVVDAFLTATRGGDLTALLQVLDPDVVRRADRAAVPARLPAVLRGARAVAEETATNARRARFAVPALVNGTVGAVLAPRGRLVLAFALTIRDDKITELDVIADPQRLRGLELAVLPSP
jgi:RNA polymerase sigma factor (sigma-70 family)